MIVTPSVVDPEIESGRWAFEISEGRALFEIESPTHDASEDEFELASIHPRNVAVSQAGQELWRGRVDSQRQRRRVPVKVVRGAAVVEFATDSVGEQENAGAGGRTLAFALYDPRLSVTKP